MDQCRNNADVGAGADPSIHAFRQVLADLADFSRRRGNEGNARRLDELAEKVIAQTFNLVVFGEFKRGKTTFINSLIGEDLLPSSVVPLTSVVTILHHGAHRDVEVEFLDGHVEHPQTTQIADYVTEKGNPENVRGVRLVRVAVPSPLLHNGLQLVDTPGVGSVYEHNTETTLDFLPQVDGAILLVASDPPISRNECEFLARMRPHVARLFVVQNKIDQLRPEDAAESLEFTSRVLCDVLGEDGVEVFAVSAREALEAQLTSDADRLRRSGLPKFTTELRRFQEHEQARTLMVSVVRNAMDVAEDERLGLDLERQAMNMSLEEIQRRSQAFRDGRERLLTQREDDTTLIRAAARKLIAQTLQHDYEHERKSRRPEIRRRLAEWAEQQQDVPAGELVQRGNAFVRDTLFEILGKWRTEEEQRIGEKLADSLERFTARANEALAGIYDLAREVFELPPRSVQTIGYLSAPSRFLWQDREWEIRSGIGISAVAGWLPGARERTLKTLEERLLSEHDKACGRLRHDFAERARAAFDEYIRSVDYSLTEAILGIDRAIDRAIAQKQRTTEEAQVAEERITEEETELARLADALTATAQGATPHSACVP